jgi:CheY-like chemotaxis protein
MTSPRAILVVDDDRDQREPLALLLEARGYAVTVAANAPAALALLRQGLRPCLIVLDLMMPDMSGEDFRREQLRDPALADIPVLLYSAGFDLPEAAHRLGALGHVLKPELDTLAVIAEHC